MAQTGVTLIVGADGLIGGALEAYLRSSGQPVVATTRRADGIDAGRIFLDMAARPLDLQIPQKINAAVLCAAVTGYSSCENDPSSRLVNVTNTVRLASRLLDQGAFVIFLSSNAVFSGTRPFATESAAVDPTTAYGRQKAEAETQLLSLAATNPSTAGRLAIVRLTKVVSAGTSPFSTWIDQLMSGKVIQPFSDLIFSPVSMAFVVQGLVHLLQVQEGGIHHCTGSADLSYAAFAVELARHLKADPNLVQPVTSVQAGVNLPLRPAYVALGVTSVKEVFGKPEPASTVVSELAPSMSAINTRRTHFNSIHKAP